jgi:hypothetical protein
MVLEEYSLPPIMLSSKIVLSLPGLTRTADEEPPAPGQLLPVTVFLAKVHPGLLKKFTIIPLLPRPVKVLSATWLLPEDCRERGYENSLVGSVLYMLLFEKVALRELYMLAPYLVPVVP